MADDTSATIHNLFQPKPKTGAERARAYRIRKRRMGKGHAPGAPVTPMPVTLPVTPTGTPLPVTPAPVTPVTPSRHASRVTPDVTPVTPSRVTLSWRHAGWTVPPPPAFAELEKTTAELVAACQRGLDAARRLTLSLQ